MYREAGNVLRTCEDKGSVIITKTVKNPPPGFDKGDFEVTLNCWTGTGLVTKVETLTYPGMLTKTVFDLPIGSTCTIAETNWRLCPPDQATSGSRPCFPFPQDRSLPIRLAVSRCRS